MARQEGRDYEPAAVLLERIRASRAEGDGATTRSRRARTPRRKGQGVEEASGGDQEGSLEAASETSATAPNPSADDDAALPIDQDNHDEVIAVVREVFASGGPRPRDEAIREVAAALGYRRTGRRIDNALRTAVRRGILENTAEGLRLLCRTITDYDRGFLVEQLLAGMTNVWWEQDDLIHSTARWLGFRRTGPVIRDTLNSAIALALRRSLLERDGPRLRKAR